MSSDHNEDETQLETQEVQTQVAVDINEDAEDQVIQMDDTKPAEGKKREKKDSVDSVKEPGKSLLPFARVQKIIKADRELPMVAKEATFLISIATEEFIKRLCQAGQHVAQREKRSTVLHRDVAAAVQRVDEFLFLEEVMPWTSVDSKRPKPKTSASGSTLLHQIFNAKQKAEDGDDGGGGQAIITNEDGTMYASGLVEDE